MPLVCRYRPNRSRQRRFTLTALERISCSIYESGEGTAEEIREAVEKCLPPNEEECQEERTLIEQAYPLLIAGLAGAVLLLPLFRVLRVARAAFFGAANILTRFLSGLPWVGRFFERSNITGTVAGASFEASMANLTPEYIAAVAQSQTILARINAAVKVEGVVTSLLFLAGIATTLFDIIPGGPDGEQTDDGA